MWNGIRIRRLCGLLTLALVAAVSAVASSSAGVARPALTMARRAPLVVTGAHFRAHETVRLAAASGGVAAAVTVTTTGRGQLIGRFPHFAASSCVRTVVRATGRSGDRATLEIDPKPGSTGLPCGL